MVILLSFVFVAGPLLAQDSKFQSAYLYQFGRIMNWPDLGDDFVIAIWGDSEVTPLVEKIAEIKKVQDKKIIVRRVTDLGQLTGSNIVFVPDGASAAIGSITTAVAGKGVLVVSEERGTVKSGAGISFIKVDGKMLFELHKANIAAGGLKSTLALERIAHKVY